MKGERFAATAAATAATGAAATQFENIFETREEKTRVWKKDGGSRGNANGTTTSTRQNNYRWEGAGTAAAAAAKPKGHVITHKQGPVLPRMVRCATRLLPFSGHSNK